MPVNLYLVYFIYEAATLLFPVYTLALANVYKLRSP
jgi:hypothetical protein